MEGPRNPLLNVLSFVEKRIYGNKSNPPNEEFVLSTSIHDILEFIEAVYRCSDEICSMEYSDYRHSITHMCNIMKNIIIRYAIHVFIKSIKDEADSQKKTEEFFKLFNRRLIYLCDGNMIIGKRNLWN